MIAKDFGERISTIQFEQMDDCNSLSFRLDGPWGDPAGDIEELINEAVRTAIRASIIGLFTLVVLTLLF